MIHRKGDKFKKILTNTIMIILALFLSTVLGVTIYMSIPYKPKIYTKEELIELFQNYKTLYNDTVDALLVNKATWEKIYLDDNMAFIYIDSPKNDQQLNRCFPENQEEIKTLFNQIHPNLISTSDM